MAKQDLDGHICIRASRTSPNLISNTATQQACGTIGLIKVYNDLVFKTDGLDFFNLYVCVIHSDDA